MSHYNDILNGIMDSGQAANLVDELEEELKAAKARLPDGMKECTIQFKECGLGHGWLTAANWVQHGCPTCKYEQLEKEMTHLRECLDATAVERAAMSRANQRLAEELGSLKEVLWAVQFDAEQERKAKKLTQDALLQMRKEREELQLQMYKNESQEEEQ